MEKIKVLIDQIEKEVYGLFYVYDSKYYFIYTEKEIDENDYVVLYMTQVGKETKNTESGPVETGYMLGFEVTDPSAQQTAQQSISYIVEDKKNGTQNPQIQYLPMEMIKNLKIVSKKRFKLLKSIIINNFNLPIDDAANINEQNASTNPIEPNVIEEVAAQPLNPISSEPSTPTMAQPVQNAVSNDNVVIDYRTKFFEEEDKNKELQSQIEILTQKLEEIKKIVE